MKLREELLGAMGQLEEDFINCEDIILRQFQHSQRHSEHHSGSLVEKQVPDPDQDLDVERAGEQGEEPVEADQTELNVVAGEDRSEAGEERGHEAAEDGLVRLGAPEIGGEVGGGQEVLHHHRHHPEHIILRAEQQQGGGNHPHALTISDVWIVTCYCPQNSPESRHAHRVRFAEADVGGQRPQQVLLYLDIGAVISFGTSLGVWES